MDQNKILVRAGYLLAGLYLVSISGCAHPNNSNPRPFHFPWSTRAEVHQSQMSARDSRYLAEVTQAEGQAQYYVDGVALGAISAVKIQGNYDVVYQSSPRAQAYVQVVDANIERPTAIHIQNQVLTITPTNANWKVRKDNFELGKPSKPVARQRVVIHLPQLAQLSVSNSTSVTGQLNGQQPLSIMTKDNAQVSLRGLANVQRIQANDNSKVNFYWVNSPNLIINGSGASEIALAGSAKNLFIKLKDKAVLGARYLRANQVFVQTRNSSVANVLATQKLRAFAYNKSNIYYYKYISLNNEYVHTSGNVLQVNWQN